MIFQYRESVEVVPAKVLTMETIQRELPGCPLGLARAILDLPLTDQTKTMANLKTMNNRSNEIPGTIDLFQDPRVVRFFLDNQELMMRIVSTGEGNARALFSYGGHVEQIAAVAEANGSGLIKLVEAAGERTTAIIRIIAEDPVLLGMFRTHSDEIVKLVSVLGDNSDYGLKALKEPQICALFQRDPSACIEYFRAINAAAGSEMISPLYAFQDSLTATLFAYHPEVFVRMANEIGRDSQIAFRIFENFEIAKRFSENPDAVANLLREIAGINRTDGGYGFCAFGDHRVVAKFIELIDRVITIDQFKVIYCSDNGVAIECGKKLDEVYNRPSERTSGVNLLDMEQVLGLLLSSPENFYKTINDALLDRLGHELASRGIGVLQLFQEYEIPDYLAANFLFRLVEYDRASGPGSFLSEADIQYLSSAVTRSIQSDVFDPGFYSALANAMSSMVISGKEPMLNLKFKKELESKYRELSPKKRTDDQMQVFAAIGYTLVMVDPRTSVVPMADRIIIERFSQKAVYEPELYQNDGKKTIVQVFDRSDSSEHYALTQTWFGKYSTPTRGRDGELTYETATTRMVLYMGRDAEANRRFVEKQMGETQNVIIAFRGDAIHLDANFPSNSFRNGNHVLFVMGSCFSTRRADEYVEANPEVDLRIISNEGVGRGQVNNTIVEGLMLQTSPILFMTLIKGLETGISRNSGEATTIGTTTPGDCLLEYVKSFL